MWLQAKTGISSRMLKPTLGLVDPLNMLTAPTEVAAAAGFDVLCHSLESYTALPFNTRSPRPTNPNLRFVAAVYNANTAHRASWPLIVSSCVRLCEARPAYQGSNPVSDVWSLYALRVCAEYFVRSVEDREDHEAQEAMALAAAAAGVGFGNAGCHLPHGASVAAGWPHLCV